MKNIVILCSLFLVFQSCTNENSTQDQAADQGNIAPVLLSDISNKASCVFFTKDENGNPVVSWVEVDTADNKSFFLANWNPEEEQFGSRIAIPIADNASVHEEGMPKIAFKGDGAIVAIYETNVPVEGSRFGLSDILYTLSHDKGETWTDPQTIQQNDTHVGSRSFANILRLADGEVGVSWLDTHPTESAKGRPVKFAKTTGKDGFNQAVILEPYACQCCRTAISHDGQGNLNVVYRDILPGSVRDISVSKSTDNGNTFEEPIAFSNDNWVVEGCPHNGPSIVSNNGTNYVAWYTGSQKNGVFYAELNQNNEMLTKHRLDADGRFVQLCLMPNGMRIAAFNKNYKQGDSLYSKIMVNKIGDQGIYQKEITLEKSHASYPVVHELDDKSVVAAWSDDGKIYYTLVQVSQIDEKVETPEKLSFSPEQEITVELTSETDPVCGMHIGTSATIQNTVRHDDETLGFCSEMCKSKFLAANKTII